MIYLGKYKIVNNNIAACNYDFLLRRVEWSIKYNKKLLISPIASQTLIAAYLQNNIKTILSHFDYLVPDSQWLKWSINFLYGKRLNKRVYGPKLMTKTCKLAEEKGYKVFFYGNKKSTLRKLSKNLKQLFPFLQISGEEESKFRELTKNEKINLIKKLKKTKTDIVFVSLGSPLQEIFSEEISKIYQRKIVIIPVGAAFDFISGIKKQAPKWMGNIGFEWLFRLIQEPKRLWKRYLIYGPVFVVLIFNQKIKSLLNF